MTSRAPLSAPLLPTAILGALRMRSAAGCRLRLHAPLRAKLLVGPTWRPEYKKIQRASSLKTNCSSHEGAPPATNQLFTDKISGDEMISDGYRMKDVDDIVYEVDAAMITVQDGEVDIGGNPSAEDGGDAVNSNAEQVINCLLYTSPSPRDS